MTREYQQCTWCVMDTSDPDISFDDSGRCNRCRDAEELGKVIWRPNAEGKQQLDGIVEEIKLRGRGKDYDCIIGISGGVDSAYMAYRLRKDYPDLRILAVHVDGGWNSEISVKNIEMLVKRLEIDLFTFVVNWEEMRDLQLAFMKASVPNQDIPQDHAFFAALYNLANEHKIKYFLSGGNFATESILPISWGHAANDLGHIKKVHRMFGKRPLNVFPTMSLWRWYFYYPRLKKLRTIRPLNYLPYNKVDAKVLLGTEIGWSDYGDKHHESVFTKFFQSYYLPKKFGIDKRKAHLSSLIVSSQITRETALKILETPPYDGREADEGMIYLAKKLGISVEEFEGLLSREPRAHADYGTSNWVYKLRDFVKRFA